MQQLEGLERPELVELARQHKLPNLRAKSAVLIEQLEELFARSGREVVRSREQDEIDDLQPVLMSRRTATDDPVRASHHQSTSSNGSFAYLVLLVCLLVASIAVSVNLYLQLDGATYTMAGMQEEIRLYEQMIEDMGAEKNDLISKVDVFKEKKEQAEAHFEEINSKYLRLRKKYEELSKRHGVPPEKDEEPPKTAAPSTDDEDDHEEKIYCWLDGLFGTAFFEGSCTPQAKKRQGGKPSCPFKSTEHALKELKMRPEWIKLQRADRYSKERSKLIKELSRKMHPDKLVALGCPSEYGDALMQAVNSMRTERVAKNREPKAEEE